MALQIGLFKSAYCVLQAVELLQFIITVTLVQYAAERIALAQIWSLLALGNYLP
jgi:hypothetical protein